MYVRKKKYPSGNIGIIVVEKTNGKMNELVTIGIASSDDEIDGFVNQGKEWIEREKERIQQVLLSSLQRTLFLAVSALRFLRKTS